MRRILCATIAILLLLTACTASEPKASTELTGHYTQGIYELRLSVEWISGWPFGRWSFSYSCKGETITNGYQILVPLDLFTYYAIQIEVTEKNNLANTYSSTFPVPILDGGFGKNQVTVTGSDGRTATFKITCNVTQVGKQ